MRGTITGLTVGSELPAASMQCGCRLTWQNGIATFTQCRLHKAAPALIEALVREVSFREEVMEVLLGSGERAGRLDAGRARNRAEQSRAAIQQAKEEEEGGGR
jgi:hypothetical protein